MEHAPGTVAFFQAMAPVLIANVLTVAFVYSFAKIQQKGARGRGGRSPHLYVADRVGSSRSCLTGSTLGAFIP